MYLYYFNLALRSFMRNKLLTLLMVLAIALGIGTSMTTLTVFHVLSGDPIPQKSDRLYHVQLDPLNKEGYKPGKEPVDQLTRFDAEELLRQHKARRQALMTGGAGAVSSNISTITPFIISIRYTSSDFFQMFDAPFIAGHGWSKADDDDHGRVAVITSKLSQKLFGTSNGVGHELRVENNGLRVIGVLDDWDPKPHFYDLNVGKYDADEQAFVPFTTAIDLKLGSNGTMDCFGRELFKGDFKSVNAPCAWMQYWVELDSPSQADDFKLYLNNYSEQQRAAGRFERPANIRLRNVLEWLDYNHAVPSDVRLQMWLAFGFLGICLINTVGLMLAKFLRRSGEIGVRRALGASQRDIFLQYLVEAGTVGMAGGIIGICLAELGLLAVRHRPASYAQLAHLDGTMLLVTFALAIAASLIAGLLPAWRAMHITPAVQLKMQ